MNSIKVLKQFILSISIDFSLQSEIGEEIDEDITSSFNNIHITDTSLDAITLYSANMTLNNLFHTNQSLQTSIRKHIPQLISIIKWFLVENIILHYEVKRYQDMLRARKEWEKEKRFILKNKIVISINEVLVAIEIMEKVTQKKKKKIDIDKSWDRSRKIQEFVVISENEDEDSNFLEYENIEIE